MPLARPNVRTATIATIRLSTGGGSAALAITQAAVAVSAPPQPSAAVAARQARASRSRCGRIASSNGRHFGPAESIVDGVDATGETARTAGWETGDGESAESGTEPPRATTRSHRASTAG